jgi:hypothetical protein
MQCVSRKRLPNNPAESTIVVDNAPYYPTQVDKSRPWPTRHNIACTADLTKPELLLFVKIHFTVQIKSLAKHDQLLYAYSSVTVYTE